MDAYAKWFEPYYAVVLDAWKMKSSVFFLVRSPTNYASEIVIFANIFYILSRWDSREEFCTYLVVVVVVDFVFLSPQ